MKSKLLALVATAALAIGSSAASAATLIGSYWVGAGPLWSDNFPQTAYSPLDAAVLLFGPGNYSISTSSSVITYTGWVDGFGTSEHLKRHWDIGAAGTPVAQDFLPRPLYDTTGAYSAYICDRECIVGEGPDSPNASINYVFAEVPEPATWALLVTGFGMVGFAMRRRTAALTA